MRRSVLLAHTGLPPGPGPGDHLDWMLERGTAAPGRLITFRLGIRPDAPGRSDFVAERTGDHRAAYLDHEGPVSGGRGTVARLARWRVLGLWEPGPDRLEAVLSMDGHAYRFMCRAGAGGAWRIVRIPEPDVGWPSRWVWKRQADSGTLAHRLSTGLGGS